MQYVYKHDFAFVCKQIFQNAVMEAKNAASDIQNSIADQKQMLALSAQQHEDVSLSLALKISIFITFVFSYQQILIGTGLNFLFDSTGTT